MKRSYSLMLLLALACVSPIALPGCGPTESGPIAPEKFAPPPTDGDKVSSDKG